MDNPRYKQSAQSKLERSERFGIRVVCTYPADEPDIEDILTKKLRAVGVQI